QCHDAGTCDPATGTCSNPATPDGTACHDGNACTRTDTCQARSEERRVGNNCAPADQCHDAGTCDPATGTCSNPATPDGTACHDGNACTRTDTCQAGLAAGTNSIPCAPRDQCHDAGTCDPATGTCSNPATPDGTACHDGNACTRTDTCQAGLCAGTNPVTCAPADQCHDASTGDPATDPRSHPPTPYRPARDEGNACTPTDTCQAALRAGTNPVTCAPADQSHPARPSSDLTGTCSNPATPDGTACHDGNACTRTDTCQAGLCAGTNPVTCAPADQCHDASTGDPATDPRSHPPTPYRPARDEGNACTPTDTCQAALRAGTNPVTCAPADQSHPARPSSDLTGTCSNPATPDGTACHDGNACTRTDTCQAGLCAGTNPVTCAPADQCHDASTGDPATDPRSHPPTPYRPARDEGNACTPTDTCQAALRAGTNPVTCAPADQSHPARPSSDLTGTCSNPVTPDGTACHDGNACTRTDTCQAGLCAGTNPVTCAPPDPCHDAGTYNPATCTGSNAERPDGTACNDVNASTRTDTCQAGVCAGTNPVTCAPADQCHDAGTCDPATGACSNPATPNGAACNDGNACTGTDTCQAGVCSGTNPVGCVPPDACHDAVCDKHGGCKVRRTQPAHFCR